MTFIIKYTNFECNYGILSHYTPPNKVEPVEKEPLFSATQRLQAVFEAVLDGIIVIDEQGIMEMINPAAARMFGYSISELKGQNISMLMPETHARMHDQYIQRYLETGEKRIIGIGREVEGQRKDGSTFPIWLSVTEARTQGHSLFTGVVRDITQEKQAALAIKQEQERAQRYLDIANTIIVVLDQQGRLELLNHKGCEVLEYQEEDLLGRDWLRIVIPPQQYEHVAEVFEQLMKGKIDGLEYFESYIQTRSGQLRLIAWRNALITNEQGEVTGAISSGEDITEKRAAEERIIRLNAELEKRVDQRTEELAGVVNQLLSTNKKLEHEIQERRAAEEALRRSEQELRRAYEKERELNELKSRFVSMASHEFRTPLSTILSSADLVEAYTREDQQDKRLRHTNRIKASVSNLTGILNDFLSLSKLEEGKVGIQPVAFPLKEFMHETLDEMNGVLKSGQSIRSQLPDTTVELYTDKKILKNIFFNLLSNASKYSQADMPIDCRVQVQDGQLLLEIADQGIGIPKEEQALVFSRFFRAHNAENIPGTGLGLNIVKRYVDLLQGSITFESEPGKGTTFRCVLPARIDITEVP